MNNVKYSVGDDRSEERGDCDGKEQAINHITGNHNLRRKVFTKFGVAISTQNSKEHQEDDNGQKEHEYECIANGNVTFQGFIEGYDRIEKGQGCFGDDETTHGQGESS